MTWLAKLSRLLLPRKRSLVISLALARAHVTAVRISLNLDSDTEAAGWLSLPLDEFKSHVDLLSPEPIELAICYESHGLVVGMARAYGTTPERLLAKALCAEED